MNIVQKFLLVVLVLSVLHLIHPLSGLQEEDRRGHTERIIISENEARQAQYEREIEAKKEGMLRPREVPFMRQATPEEFQAWLQGYARNGGNASRYSGVNVSQGVSVMESNFSTYVDELGHTNWLVPEYDYEMGDGSIRYILVPSNVTYLGGGVGKDKSIMLMKNFTVIEGQ
jgi:hypothetical protein